MVTSKTFSLKEISKALNSLGVSFVPSIPADDTLQFVFASFESVVEGGIYYCASSFKLPVDVTSSVVLSDQENTSDSNIIIKVDDPQLVYYRLMNFFYPQETQQLKSGIHPTAVIDPDAEISKNAYVGPYCVVGKAKLEDGVMLHSHVVVFDNSTIKQGVVVEPHSTIGATGVAWIRDEKGERVRQPQIGGVIVGENTFLGTDVTVVRGSVNENTEIGKNCVIAHGSKIGHGAKIKDEVHFANNISIAGNAHVGEYSFLGAACVLRPRVSIAPRTIVAAGSVVVKNVDEQDMLVVGVPGVVKAKPSKMSGVPKNH